MVSKNIFIAPILTVVILLIGIFAYGKLVGPVNISLGQNSNRTFDVTGTGKASVVPNSFITTFNINESAVTQKVAQDKGNAKQEKALEVLNSLGFAKKDIQTTNYSVNPNYDYSNSQNKITGYVMDQSTTIKSKDKTKIEQAIDKITALGINIQGVTLDTLDDSKAKDEARKNAVEDARSKAEDLAKAAGFKLGKIASIREESASVPIPLRTLDGVSGVSEKTNIEPGSNEVTSTIIVTYYIND